MAVAGASRYLTSATLANTQGRSPSIPTVASSLSSTLSLLDIGKSNAPGIGLSGRSRAGISQFLNETQGLYNSLFTLGAGASLSVSGLQTQILGLRAQFGDDQIADQVKNSDFGNDLNSRASALGLLVDEEA